MEGKELTTNIGVLDAEDLAGLLRVSKLTATRYINKGLVPAYKIAPGKYLISARQLISHIEKHTLNTER